MSFKDIGHHTSHEYNQELEDLRNKVLQMGGLVEKQLSDATSSLLNNDFDLAEKVFTSDHRVNKMEVDIDEFCAQIIARRQPAAGDLRLIITAIKVTTDLERIGDEAEKIGRFAGDLIGDETISSFKKEVKHIAKLANTMVNNALDAYARVDDKKAIEVATQDLEIDKEFDNLSRLLITYMIEDARNIRNILKINWCARSIERIGDHAKNICEYVVYLVKGKDIRHTDI